MRWRPDHSFPLTPPPPPARSYGFHTGTFDLIFTVLYRKTPPEERSVWREVGVGADHYRPNSTSRLD